MTSSILLPVSTRAVARIVRLPPSLMFDIPKSSTRREDLLLSPDELEAINIIRKALNGMKADEAVEKILDMFARTKNNYEFVNMVKCRMNDIWNRLPRESPVS